MSASQSTSFGVLLRNGRVVAGLTQEALADRSGLGIRSIQGLERGETRPRRETLRRLTEALRLAGEELATFERVGRPSPRRHHHSGSLADGARHQEETQPTSRLNPEIHLITPAPEYGHAGADRLVGRTREVNVLRTKLEGALANRGSVVLVGGEAGIGKTRLVEELAVEAGQHGMLVLWGRCWESEGAPPLWPWIEIVRGIVRHRGPLLRSDLGSGAPLIAGLVPEIHEALRDLPPAPPLEPGEGRFRLFDAVTTALQNVSRSQPLLLVLEDLHWADKPSLVLLEFFLHYIAGARVVLIGTYRDTELHSQHPLADMLGSAQRERCFDSIPLVGLSVGAIGELLTSFQAHPQSAVAASLAQALWQATEGNPLFVREEIRSLVDDDRLPIDGDDRDATAWILELRLPQRVRDVIDRRISRLSATTRNLLTVAAVIGREFAAAILEQSSGFDEATTDAALDEAQASHVIEELPRTVLGYRFTHALFREALYASLATRRRMRMHRQVAQALERVHAHDIDSHISELAYHYGEAQALRGNEKFVHFSLLAGDQALDSNAYDEGARHFQRGLDARAGKPMDDEQAALLFGLARAQTATLELPRARDVVANLTRAFDHYATRDVDRAVAVAECAVDALPGQAVGSARLVARALALVTPDSHAAGRLLSRYGRMVAIEEGDYRAATDSCDRALAIARREGDFRLEIQALGNGAEADLNFLHWQPGLAKCLLAIDLARRTDALQAEMLARFFASIILWFLGRLHEADQQVAALTSRAEQLRDRRWRVSSLWMAGTIARYRGQWAAARDYTDRGLELSPADPRLLWTRISLEHDVGDLALAKSLVARLLDIVPLSPTQPTLAQASTALALAVLPAAVLGSDTLPLAESTAEAILSMPTTTDLVSRVSHASLAMMAVRGHSPSAGRHYTALESARGTILYESITGDRLLGLVSLGMGDAGRAEAHFEDAIRFCRNGGCRPELAWTCYDLAELLRGNGGPRDVERASGLLDEALNISRELGMMPLIQRVLDCRASLQA